MLAEWYGFALAAYLAKSAAASTVITTSVKRITILTACERKDDPKSLKYETAVRVQWAYKQSAIRVLLVCWLPAGSRSHSSMQHHL